MKKIDYYFDFLSPYSYVSWIKLRKFYPDISLEEMNFYPVLLGSLMSHWGQVGPAEIESKRDFLFRTLLRECLVKGIALETPKVFPFNPLYAIRLAQYFLKERSDQAVDFIDQLWKFGWSHGGDYQSVEELDQLLKKNGVEESCEDICSRREIRAQVKRNFKEALKNNIFGVPTWIVDGELFWGQDSLEMLQNALAGKDPLPREKYQSFLVKHPFKTVDKFV